MDYLDYKLCDRCKCHQVLLNCISCSPYNNFCSKCDTDVHSLPSKMKHKRTPLSQSFQSQSQSQNQLQQQIKSQMQTPQTNCDSILNIQQFNQQQPCVNTDNPALFYYPAANLSFLETRQSDQRTTFTRDYVNELKSIHQKEKDELLFKISSLQSALDRLKASFGEHVNKMHVSVEENNKLNTSRIKQYEEENDYKRMKVIIDKDNLITQLKKENEELKKHNDIACQSIKQNDTEVKQIKASYVNQISSLSNELNNVQNEIEALNHKSFISCEAIQKEANNKIKEISSSQEAKLNELCSQYSNQIDSLQANLDNTLRQLFITKEKMNEDKKEYDNQMNKLQEENIRLRNEIQYSK